MLRCRYLSFHQIKAFIFKLKQNENEKIGIIGLILVLSGLVGAVIGGVVLDKTKAFKYYYHSELYWFLL
jgi:hypothetical protein